MTVASAETSMPPNSRAAATRGPRHLLGLEGAGGAWIESILDRAEAMLESGPVAAAPLAGRIIAMLFLEPSTRTRLSFEIAAQRLGARVVSTAAGSSSVSKGETVLDTVRNIAAMGVDAVVLRAAQAGAAVAASAGLAMPLINGGDGRHEHPTQGLLDLLSLRRSLGSLRGRRVGIVGDILNSRVARSEVHGLLALGAVPVLIGPATLVPPSLAGLGGSASATPIERCHDFDAVLETLDAVVMLRVQRERAAGDSIASDYPRQFRLDRRRAGRLRPSAPILHPGPVNRGFEVEAEVADDRSRSLILQQVAHGVAVRMAVLEWAVGGPN